MNKTVIVTGGSAGIGKSIAAAFAKENDVIICARSKIELEKTAHELKCDFMECDVSNEDQVKDLVEYVVKRHGKIDILVNCAGIYGPIGRLEDNDSEKWKKTIEINLIGTMLCTKYVLPYMKKNGKGTVINMAGAGIGGELKPNLTAYTASKAAIVGFTESVAREVEKDGITVNAIAPGAVNTRLLDEVIAAGDKAGHDLLEQSKKQKKEGGTPPEKAAELALFLAETGKMTGKILSAVWDDYRSINPEGSLYNLRRIDNFRFFEKR